MRIYDSIPLRQGLYYTSGMSLTFGKAPACIAEPSLTCAERYETFFGGQTGVPQEWASIKSSGNIKTNEKARAIGPRVADALGAGIS